MTDIVDRLRKDAATAYESKFILVHETMTNAADEIELLRKLLAKCESEFEAYMKEKVDEIDEAIVNAKYDALMHAANTIPSDGYAPFELRQMAERLVGE